MPQLCHVGHFKIAIVETGVNSAFRQMAKLLLELKDEQIIAEFKATQSTEYFKTLITRHRERLFNTAMRILGCPDEAEEVLQETFIKALQNISKFRGNASLSAWLYTITHNLCIDALRMRYKKRFYYHWRFDPSSTYDPLRKSRHVVTQLPDKLPGPAEQAELKEQMKMVARSLSYIPAKQRTVVILHDMDGLSYQDIATITCTNIGTVRSRLHYGRRRLRKILRACIVKHYK